jgi:hypothetical protein
MPAPRDRAARVANYMTAEDEDIPNLCSACLGPSTHVRMMRVPKGKVCHTCQRPYAVFNWRASGDSRPRSTLICRGCSDAKNACQSCMHDLATGLSMEKRAQLSAEEIAAILDRKRSRTTEEEVAALAANQSQLQRRFQQRACSFFAKGNCSRGDACPYRHVMPGRTEGEVPAKADAAQSIKARFAAAPTVVARDTAVKDAEAKKEEGTRLLLEMAASAPVVATSSSAATASALAAVAQEAAPRIATPVVAPSKVVGAKPAGEEVTAKTQAVAPTEDEDEAAGGGFDFGFMDE